MSKTPTLRVEARFKNARLYNAIAVNAIPALARTAHGRRSQELGPVRTWCQFHGIECNHVYALINLRRSPWRVKVSSCDGIPVQVISPLGGRIAQLLELEPDYLFPADLYQAKWPTLATDVDHHRMIPLIAAPRRAFELPPAQEAVVEHRELADLLARSLHTLTPRQERIIKMRFGLDGEEPQTWDQIGVQFGVCRERVRQIEQKALRRLRHPSRSRRLESFATKPIGEDEEHEP